MDSRDPRMLRLFDLREDQYIRVQCRCGMIVQYGRGRLQQSRRVPSDTLIYDLQFRLRCKRCNRREDFRISIGSSKLGPGGFDAVPEIVIVEPLGPATDHARS